MNKREKDRLYNPRLRIGVLRRGQFIAPFGVGSIMALPDESLMPACIDLWAINAGKEIYDERLQKRLRVNYFKMAPSNQDFKDGIPFFRFPKWLFCSNSKCRSLRHIDDWNARYKAAFRNGELPKIPLCDVCKTKLVPSRFIVACPKGHIDDFPWVKWVHGEKPCIKPDLKITAGGSTSGLVGIVVSCNTCKESANMSGAFGKDVHKKCSGMKPWTGNTVGEECDAQPRTLQRGASNAYFPKVVTSIVIPPYSDSLVELISQTQFFNYLASQSGGLGDDDCKVIIKMIAQQIGRNVDEVSACVNKMLGESSNDVQKESDYRYDEYMAFQGCISEGELDSRSFKIEIRDSEEYDIPGVKSVVLVHRLREVRALVAFSRIKPLDRNEWDNDNDKDENQAKAVSVREDKNINWLPAIEVRGEGIFIRFDDKAFDEWESSPLIQERASIVNSRYEAMAKERGREVRYISPKFLFLHTLAHLLIRQLSFECGYGSASLRERIYCDEEPGEPKMSGVLVYTASGDAEGTLGGLVLQGKPEFLNSIVQKAIEHAAWCSSDPLCIESTGQGMDSLNLAACHACALLPETCCEEFNRLLDRGMVIGTPEKPEIGFMSGLIRY